MLDPQITQPQDEDVIRTGGGVKFKTLLSWKAPERPYQKRSQEFYKTAGSLAFLFAVILIFFKEWFLIIVIASILFLVYVLSNVPPNEIEHKITNKGIEIAQNKYNWNELGDYWFSNLMGQRVLNIILPFKFPGKLILVLGNQNEKELTNLLDRFLNYQEPNKNFLDKGSEWLSKKLPLEKLQSPLKAKPKA